MKEQAENWVYLPLMFTEDEQLYFLEEEKDFFVDVEVEDTAEVSIESEENKEVTESVEAIQHTEEAEVKAEPKPEPKQQPQPQEDKAQKVAEEGVRFFGENTRNILVLLEYSQDNLLKSKEFELLLKIMGAINLTLHEFAVVNLLQNEGVSFEKLKETLKPVKTLYFSASNESYLFEQPLTKYESFDYKDVEVVPSDSLSQMLIGDEARDKKKQLWEALQQYFLKS